MTSTADHAPNRAQAEAWNGPEAANWARLSSRPVEDADLVAPLLRAMAIEAHERVLDVGCGTGAMTRRAAALAARGHALGVDLSALMVEQARTEAADEGRTNVAFEVGDAQVHPFPPERFDVVVSHFGAMFFDDPAAAFANLASAVRPGGRLGLVVPRAMARCAWYVEPLRPLLGAPPTPDTAPSRMFSLADPERVRGLLTIAGFTAPHVRPLDAALWFGADVEAAIDGFAGAGPVRAVRDRRPEVTDEQVRDALRPVMERFLGRDGVRIPGAHWLVTARR